MKSRCEARIAQKDEEDKDVLPFCFDVLLTKTVDGPLFEVDVSDTPTETRICRE